MDDDDSNIDDRPGPSRRKTPTETDVESKTTNKEAYKERLFYAFKTAENLKKEFPGVTFDSKTITAAARVVETVMNNLESEVCAEAEYAKHQQIGEDDFEHLYRKNPDFWEEVEALVAAKGDLTDSEEDDGGQAESVVDDGDNEDVECEPVVSSKKTPSAKPVSIIPFLSPTKTKVSTSTEAPLPIKEEIRNDSGKAKTSKPPRLANPVPKTTSDYREENQFISHQLDKDFVSPEKKPDINNSAKKRKSDDQITEAEAINQIFSSKHESSRNSLLKLPSRMPMKDLKSPVTPTGPKKIQPEKTVIPHSGLPTSENSRPGIRLPSTSVTSPITMLRPNMNTRPFRPNTGQTLNPRLPSPRTSTPRRPRFPPPKVEKGHDSFDDEEGDVIFINQNIHDKTPSAAKPSLTRKDSFEDDKTFDSLLVNNIPQKKCPLPLPTTAATLKRPLNAKIDEKKVSPEKKKNKPESNNSSKNTGFSFFDVDAEDAFD